MTYRAIAIALSLLASLALSGCTLPKYTSYRTLGAIEADPARYDGQLVSLRGTARDVSVNNAGMRVLVSTELYEQQFIQVEFLTQPPHPDIVRGDYMRALGYVRKSDWGDRLTRTVSVDAAYLEGPHNAYYKTSQAELVERWQAGEPVALQ